MIYQIIIGVAMTIACAHACGFGVWQFRERNVCGGIFVWMLALGSEILGMLALWKM